MPHTPRRIRFMGLQEVGDWRVKLYGIAHDGRDGCYALIDWWANENEVHQRLLSAPLDDPAALRPHPTLAIGCVWELAVTDFERRAWLEHVLAREGGPNVDGYLAARFEGKV